MTCKIYVKSLFVNLYLHFFMSLHAMWRDSYNLPLNLSNTLNGKLFFEVIHSGSILSVGKSLVIPFLEVLHVLLKSPACSM